MSESRGPIAQSTGNLRPRDDIQAVVNFRTIGFVMTAGAKATGPDFAAGVPLTELAENGTIVGRVGNEPVLLSRFAEEMFAVSGTCTHYGSALEPGTTLRRLWGVSRVSSRCRSRRRSGKRRSCAGRSTAWFARPTDQCSSWNSRPGGPDPSMTGSSISTSPRLADSLSMRQRCSARSFIYKQATVSRRRARRSASYWLTVITQP